MKLKQFMVERLIRRARHKNLEPNGDAYISWKDFIKNSRKERKIPPCPFLEHPGEIRNQIYRLLLSGTAVVSRPVNPLYRAQTFDTTDTPSLDGPLGSIHCQNIWKQDSRFDMSILRVNRQMNSESSAVFKSESLWFRVLVDIPGYGRELKRRGFGMICSDTTPFPRKKTCMEIMILFGTPSQTHPLDSFLLSLEGHEMLSRALRYTVGSSHADIYIDIFHGFERGGPSVMHPKVKELVTQHCRELMENFSIQSSGHLILGIPGRGSFKMLHKDDVLCLLESTMYSYDKEHPRGRLSIESAGKLEAVLALCNDYGIIRGPIFLRRTIHWERMRCGAVRLVLALVDIEMHLQRYQHVVSYVSYALKAWKFVPESEAHMLLLRARAYAAFDR